MFPSVVVVPVATKAMRQRKCPYLPVLPPAVRTTIQHCSSCGNLRFTTAFNLIRHPRSFPMIGIPAYWFQVAWLLPIHRPPLPGGVFISSCAVSIAKAMTGLVRRLQKFGPFI
ncbi:MAG: hypothetical protein EBS30_07790, partial [Planctomycetes bacterium]|nr:hypothetical protein [Planctomycetota bacterium]